MAIKRKAKAKAKTKVKRRKAPAKRTAVRRKVAKVVRKARKVPRKVAKKPVRRPAPKRAAPAPEVPGVRIGVVTHYYGGPMVAVVKLESATLRVGDRIHIRGHTSDFAQEVVSLQVEHAAVEEVGPDDDFGLKVVEHAREHDVVYKLS